MIIPTNDIDEFDTKLELEDSADVETVHNLKFNLTEPPPKYDFKPAQSVSPPSCMAEASSRDETQKAVNFVHRHIYFDSIYTNYVINPDYQDPLPGSSRGKQRKNLFLRSECGHIDVDVRVMHTEAGQRGSGSNEPRKVTLDFRTTFGSIDAKVHASSLPDRLPIRLLASSNCGPVKISLPKSFQGFLILSLTLGELSLSPKIKEKMSWDNRNGKTRTIFIGESFVLRSRLDSRMKNNIGPWAGDEVHLDAICGSVTIDFVDETSSLP